MSALPLSEASDCGERSFALTFESMHHILNISEAELMLTHQDFLTGITYLKLFLNDAKLRGSRIYSPLLMYPTAEGEFDLHNLILFFYAVGFAVEQSKCVVTLIGVIFLLY